MRLLEIPFLSRGPLLSDVEMRNLSVYVVFIPINIIPTSHNIIKNERNIKQSFNIYNSFDKLKLNQKYAYLISKMCLSTNIRRPYVTFKAEGLF